MPLPLFRLILASLSLLAVVLHPRLSDAASASVLSESSSFVGKFGSYSADQIRLGEPSSCDGLAVALGVTGRKAVGVYGGGSSGVLADDYYFSFRAEAGGLKGDGESPSFFTASGSVDFGRAFSGNGFGVEPFVGLGYDLWKYRNIDEYVESLHLRVGVRGEAAVTHSVSVFGEVGAKTFAYPYFNLNGTPEKDPLAFVSAGVRYENFRAFLFLNDFAFVRSRNDIALDASLLGVGLAFGY